MKLNNIQRNKITVKFLKENVKYEFGLTWHQLVNLGNGIPVDNPSDETIRIVSLLG